MEVEAYEYTPASISPCDMPFYDAVRSTLSELAPGCATVPQISAGMSDSRFWRKLGSVVYGCVPYSPETKIRSILPGVHGPNERVNTSSLEFGTRFLYRLIPRTLS